MVDIQSLTAGEEKKWKKKKEKPWGGHNKHTKKLKPGLVASYDIRPGNGEDLFWFRHFINLPLT